MLRREKLLTEGMLSSSTKKDSSEDANLKSARDKWMASSSSESQTPAEPRYDGWESTAFEELPMPEDDKSKDFLEKIQQIKGKTIKDIVALIPAHATGQVTGYNDKGPGFDWQGFMFAWKSPQCEQWKVLVHAPDDSPRIEARDNNTVKHWTVRVRKGADYMDSSGKFHSSKKANPGPHGVESIINDTHIPIQTPKSPFRNPVTHPDQDTPWGQEQVRRMRAQ